MEKKDITKSELKKVVRELNEQLGLEPPILENLKKEALETAIEEASSLIDPENDEFSEEVWEIMNVMGWTATQEETEEEREETEEEELAEEEREETEDDRKVGAAIAETLAADFMEAKKLVPLKALAQEWEYFNGLDLDKYTGLQGARLLKAAMMEVLPEAVLEILAGTKTVKVKPVKEKKVKPVKEKKAPAPKSMSRLEAAVIAYAEKNEEDAKELAARADMIYEDAGGASNLKESLWSAKLVLNVLDAAKTHGLR